MAARQSALGRALHARSRRRVVATQSPGARETGRQQTPYVDIEESDYRRFSSWGKRRIQPGVQIIDLLPASRDDLVSLSVSEGGAIAKASGKAEAYGMYDVSQANMAREAVGEALTRLQESARSASGDDIGGPLGALEEVTGERQAAQSSRRQRDRTRSSENRELSGYGASARGKGSIFGAARSAIAYAKRREYLDAAITAAGRGDNFAKWVIRKSDLRSGIAGTDPRNVVASAHSGYPNGDQPFHMMVKIPHAAVQQDWVGRDFILFNSAYAATAPVPWWKHFGFLGIILRLPLLVLNPTWYSDVGNRPVATAYPFKWDVKKQREQKQLMMTPNYLGGRIELDDTSKIKYSEVSNLINAEAEFIKLTRSAQSEYLGQVMDDLEEQDGDIRKDVGEALQKQWTEYDEVEQLRSQSQQDNTRIHELEAELEQIRQEQAEPPPEN